MTARRIKAGGQEIPLRGKTTGIKGEIKP